VERIDRHNRGLDDTVVLDPFKADTDPHPCEDQPHTAPRVPVSAIVVTYFTGPLLARAIASIKNQPDIAEIIVVDNGNWPDAVAKAVEPEAPGPRVKILSGHGNVGFSAACNMGAREATSPYLLFLNPDAVIPTDGVSTLLRHGIDREHPWMIGAKLVDPDGVEQCGSRRTVLTPWRAFVEMTKLYRIAPRHPYFRRFNLHADPCPGQVTAVPVTSGACFLVAAADYAMVGGMDESYFLHVEDIDFCLRFREAGGTVYFDPHVRVTHYKGSSRASRVGIEFHKTRGMQLYFRRHFSREYPALFLLFVNLGLWLRFGVYAIAHTGRQALNLVGLRKKRGKAGYTRARALVDRRAARR